MIGRRFVLKRGSRDEAEKPFWISFADLMTALMVLFLVSLSVALVQAQKDTERALHAEADARRAEQALAAEKQKLADALRELERREKERDTRRERREGDIAACHGQLEKLVAEFNESASDGIRLDRARNVIDFGSRARFELSSHELTFDQANVLRRFTSGFLSVIERHSSICRQWLKRVIVEGFTDKTGSYLLNLNLSLNRSQRVMCVLLSGEYTSARRVVAGTIRPEILPPLEPISPEHEALIKQLFLVGGYSSNSLRATDDESRRIELRIEFYQVDEAKIPAAAVDGLTGRCAIGGR
jgi:flagellar motor protein MotB